MKTDNAQESKSSKDIQLTEEYWASQMPNLLHALSNKMLPIVAFSDLGTRRCDDPELRKYFEKIRQAAGDSRDLLIQLRQQFQQNQKDLSGIYASSSDETQAL